MSEQREDAMDLKGDLHRIQEAALRAVDPERAVRRYLRREERTIYVGEQSWALPAGGRVLVVAVGKAAPGMAAAAGDVLGELATEGVVVTKYEHAAGYEIAPAFRVHEAGHPVPDAAGKVGARAVAELVSSAGADDLVLVLLSGGGSALLPLPAESLTLEDLQSTNELLLRAGATIEEINAVRKHLSAIKGGRLAEMATPAPVVALILSDVVGDPLDVIASGPTAPDPTTYADAHAVLERYALTSRVNRAVRERLAAGAGGALPETPKPGSPTFDSVTNVLVGSNRQAAQAAVAAAEALGYRALLLTTYVEGEAREVAKVAAAFARGIRAHGDPVVPPACLVWGGETTVTVRGTGKGGRNQELALAAALALDGVEGVALLALATDGTDGPTDAAGALVGGETAARARSRGWDLYAALDENDAYPLLDDLEALLRIGPTGTNVNDLLIILVAP